MAVAVETSEEKQARLMAEATAKANATMEAKALAEAIERDRAGAEKVLLYSIYPELNLVLASNKQYDIHMDNGRHKTVTDGHHKHLQFRNHRAFARADQIQRVREIGGYGMSFMEALDDKSDDRRRCAMETLIEGDDIRADTFCRSMESKGKSSGVFASVTLHVVKKEIKEFRKLKEAAKQAKK